MICCRLIVDSTAEQQSHGVDFKKYLMKDDDHTYKTYKKITGSQSRMKTVNQMKMAAGNTGKNQRK